MKISKWIGLASIALLVVGAMGFMSYRVFASTFGSVLSQNCGPEVEDDDANETAEAEDSDTNECGREGEAEDGDVNEAEEANEQDASDETAPVTTGITAAEAQAIAEKANPGAAILNVEFDREGGRDIWEVELDNGLDVKVDADTGDIVLTELRD